MKILNGLKTIKEYQVSILIAFIIVSILYGIHMFRYEYIEIVNTNNSKHIIYRVDRITNEVSLYIFPVVRGGNTKSAYRKDIMKSVPLCD
jgi:disulfide oxidoreductase YuzD